MSQTAETSAYAGLGFVIEFIRTTIETGPNMESFYNGMFGAIGALLVKVLYDVARYLIKQHKQNVQQQRKVE